MTTSPPPQAIPILTYAQLLHYAHAADIPREHLDGLLSILGYALVCPTTK